MRSARTCFAAQIFFRLTRLMAACSWIVWDLSASIPQALSLCVAPPTSGFGGDHTPCLRDSALPLIHRYIGAACHREPMKADEQESACYRTFPEALPWNPLALLRHVRCEAREGAPR